MNIQISQLKYLLALVRERNYSKAAEKSFVSQPALSMAIKKLEEELNITLIDKKTNPITLTEKGEIIVRQATKIIEDYTALNKIASELTSKIFSGTLRINIIPTLAPYVIPLFYKKFSTEYPDIELIIQEDETKNILEKLKNSEIDAGLLATPIEMKSLIYIPLFYEEFYLFSDKKINKEFADTSDIDYKNLWLLEEGHCMREQMLRICENRVSKNSTITYNSGSIESLINLTESVGGMTIIPELAVQLLSKDKKKKVLSFAEPAPVREISIIHHKYTIKSALISTIIQTIVETITPKLNSKDNITRISIEPIEENIPA